MDIKDQYIRNFLRVIAGIILMYYLYDFGWSKLQHKPIHLDSNDGWLITGCLAVLLAIEAVRAYVKRKFKNQE